MPVKPRKPAGPIPIRSLQEAYDEGVLDAPPGAFSYQMPANIREAIASYPYGGSGPVVVPPTYYAGGYRGGPQPGAPPTLEDPRYEYLPQRSNRLTPFTEIGGAPPTEPVGPRGVTDADMHTPGAPLTAEEEYYQMLQNELMAQQAQRIENKRQFDIKQRMLADEAIVNRFGQYVPAQRTVAGPNAVGLGAESLAARGELQAQWDKAMAGRAALDAIVGQQQMEAAAGPVVTMRPNSPSWRDPVRPNGLRPLVAPWADQAQLATPYDPRPQWTSGPGYARSVDAGAQGTMLGNKAFGIHTDRPTSGPGAVGGGAAKLNKFGETSVGSTQGEADFFNIERQVLGDPNDPENYPGSPYASILLREEDPGVHASQLDRTYLALRRARRRAGGQVRGGTPYDVPAY